MCPSVGVGSGNEGRVGRYRLIKRLAAGGMADIFLGHETGPRGYERTVVLKTIRSDLVEEEELIDMLMEEARIASCLEHENIVELIEVGEDQGTHFLAMDFVFGRDLAQIRDRCHELGVEIPAEHARTIIADVLDALHHAHFEAKSDGKLLRVIHRDVSPQNILVGFDGGVRLLDFGLAKAAAQLSKTRAGVLKGKYAYMSPEQVNLRTLDHRSDLFSVGVVLWELLTSKRLFYRSSDYETVRSVMRCQSPFPQTVNSNLPWGVSWVTWRSLRKRPLFRYRTGRQMRAALVEGDERDHQVARDAVADWIGQLFAKELAQREAALRRSMNDAARHRMIRDGGFELLEEVTDPDLRMRPPTIPTVGSRHRGGWWGTAMGLVGPWRWIVLMTAALVFLGISVGLYVAGSQKPEYGYLHVISDRQDARVTIGQTDVGLVPVRKVTVIPGRHRIQSVAGSQRRVLEVDIAPGENRVVKVSFEAPK